MTRDEHRNACIEASATALALARGYVFSQMPDWYKERTREEAAAAFDALPSASAGVHPIQATEEMIEAGRAANLEKNPADGLYERIWRAMSTVGRLTNPPDKKL
jgi:hypothetical protein